EDGLELGLLGHDGAELGDELQLALGQRLGRGRRRRHLRHRVEPRGGEGRARRQSSVPGGRPHGGSPLKSRRQRADAGCMDPRHPGTRSPRRPIRLAGAALFAGTLLVLAMPAAASWTLGQVGSWMIVERWEHGLGPKKVSRVTTTLLNRDRFWFGHVDDKGERWEDADSGSVGGVWTGGWTGGGNDTFLGRDSLRIDGRWLRC